MRLIMLGTGPFAVPTLQALAASRHEVLLVVTRPPQGRQPRGEPASAGGRIARLQVWSPATVNDAEAQSRLDIARRRPARRLRLRRNPPPRNARHRRLGGINLHGSLLPKYRGAAPVQWAILRGETETGNSVIQMTPGLDAGPCLGQQRTPIDPDEDAGQLEARLAAMGAELVLRVIDATETRHRTANRAGSTARPPKPRASKKSTAQSTGPARPRKSKTRSAHCAPGPAPSRIGIAKTPNHSASTSTASPSDPLTWQRRHVQ